IHASMISRLLNIVMLIISHYSNCTKFSAIKIFYYLPRLIIIGAKDFMAGVAMFPDVSPEKRLASSRVVCDWQFVRVCLIYTFTAMF
ncbi:hypothetical protein L9F63_022440, partial [Diploptera punctata]